MNCYIIKKVKKNTSDGQMGRRTYASTDGHSKVYSRVSATRNALHLNSQVAVVEMLKFYKEVIRNIYIYGSLLNIVVLIVVIIIFIRLK